MSPFAFYKAADVNKPQMPAGTSQAEIAHVRHRHGILNSNHTTARDQRPAELLIFARNYDYPARHCEDSAQNCDPHAIRKR